MMRELWLYDGPRRNDGPLLVLQHELDAKGCQTGGLTWVEVSDEAVVVFHEPAAPGPVGPEGLKGCPLLVASYSAPASQFPWRRYREEEVPTINGALCLAFMRPTIRSSRWSTENKTSYEKPRQIAWRRGVHHGAAVVEEEAKAFAEREPRVWTRGAAVCFTAPAGAKRGAPWRRIRADDADAQANVIWFMPDETIVWRVIDEWGSFRGSSFFMGLSVVEERMAASMEVLA